MKIEHKEDYILISSEETYFSEFYDLFSNKHKEFAKNNVIINISSNLIANEQEISLFLKCADIHQESGTTFVVVYQNVDVDNFPETFNIVPTLQEAEDVLEMENIQRDLGF
ncbi:hypothetical protein ACOSP6_14285 [Tenacibaculum sp. MEBiC06402]|uniref:hypothetical protein n=1 Tax=unclassified Tenacibaculum TaxID=2635139 RepID=UPI003B9AAE24